MLKKSPYKTKTCLKALINCMICGECVGDEDDLLK